MDSLLKQIRACQICEGKFEGIVSPIIQASIGSKILIIGQAPGVKTLESGRPFNDVSGERLRAWLGAEPSQFYDPRMFAIMPMAFCYPGKGRSGDLPPPKICAQTWHKQLIQQMQNVELTIFLGQYAVHEYLNPAWSVTEAVEHFSTLLPNQIALPHPSPRNRFWLTSNPWFEKEVVPILQNIIKKLTQ
ncbi:uracil-DNA glycosylase family protein (plasmid) [Pseudoalteromonas xiamenensis]|uniref:uracil-DNA glycosylase family protein n=1 Tax=Pseudoalteromonas xiamenensis TaxID=882626 RepID=UPI0027E5870C|nr:uracil-DNA glycosylase family protein [Pseudoalteromonas xiamenensis]WMN62006.1 uracil-DNA glycosylase family protein [Pseudoalteromonas xiamenensis]